MMRPGLRSTSESGNTSLRSILRDLHHTFRCWRQNPGSTAASFLALTLGIGATTTIFSIFSGLLLSPLPVTDSASLVRVAGTDYVNQSTQISMPMALEAKRQIQSVSAFAIYRQTIRNLGAQDRPLMVHVLEVDANLPAALGVHMTQGVAFQPDANLPGSPCQVALSWLFWKSRFGGLPVAGTTIQLNERPCMINGVLPPQLDIPLPADMWAPAAFDLNNLANGPNIRAWYAIARLKQGSTAAVLNAEFDSLAIRSRSGARTEHTHVHLQAVPLRDWLVSGILHSLYILFGAVTGVLSMACANVANLQLARASSRLREIAVRVAVGASRFMLIRQLLAESILLALAAAAAGLLLTSAAIRVIRNLPDTRIPRPESLAIDWRIWLFALALAVLASLLFGTLPALRLSFIPLSTVLRASVGQTETRHHQIVRKILVAVETAIATVLLIVSLLLLRSFNEVTKIDPGFQTSHLLTAYLSFPPERYGKDTLDSARFAKRVVDLLQAMPGIESATITTNGPLQSTHASAPVQIEGQPVPSHDSTSPFVVDTDITPGFRRTLGIPLIAGRDLEERDNRERGTAVLVNATFARIFFPDKNALGHRVRSNPAINTSAPWQEICGVIGDTHQDSLEDAVQPELYTPLARATGMFPSVIIRTRDDPASHLRDVEQAVHEVDGEIPVFSPRTMDQVMARRLRARSFNTALLTGFAAAALVLASFGVFAVIAYSVSQRTPEIGLRSACGASQSSIIALVVRQGMLPALYGMAVGLLLAFVLNRYLASMLYAVKPTDFAAVSGAILLLAVSALVACLVPAWRAARIDAWRALRYE